MKYQPIPIEVSYNRYVNSERSFSKNGKYYIWFWTEFSKAKTKRRKRNKQARKSRRINRCEK